MDGPLRAPKPVDLFADRRDGQPGQRYVTHRRGRVFGQDQRVAAVGVGREDNDGQAGTGVLAQLRRR